MTRALLATALALVAATALASWPPGPLQQDPNLVADVQAGYCTREVVSFTAFIPFFVQQALGDAGFPITPTPIPYKRLQQRAWQCAWPDGGNQFITPRLVRVAEYFRPDLTTVVTPCSAGDAGALCPAQDLTEDDGGVDVFGDVAFECACAVSATCTLTAGGGAAPQGVTLQPGTFTGAGCRLKACGVLFRHFTRADGGVSFDESWPPICPGGG